jgi:hypothetical protein
MRKFPARVQGAIALLMLIVGTIAASFMVSFELARNLHAGCVRVSDTSRLLSTNLFVAGADKKLDTIARVLLACEAARNGSTPLRAIQVHFWSTATPWFVWALFAVPLALLLIPVENDVVLAVFAFILGVGIAVLVLYPGQSLADLIAHA